MWRSSIQAAWIQAISIQEPSEQYHAATACLLSNRLLVCSRLPAEPGLQAEVHLEGGKACCQHNDTTPDDVLHLSKSSQISQLVYDIPIPVLIVVDIAFQAFIAIAL